MDIEEMIEKIINDGRIEDMHELSEILEDVLEHLEHCDEEKYKKYEMCLYKMAYGDILTEEMAKEIVSNMRPYGMRWDMQETEKMQEQRGLGNIRSIDFFVVMNSAYNDYRDLFNDDIEMYIRYTLDFIEDEDAKSGKIFIYFTEIPS